MSSICKLYPIQGKNTGEYLLYFSTAPVRFGLKIYILDAAYQTFEHGFLVWRSDTRTVFAMFDNGTGTEGVETWSGEELTYSQQPPAGLYLPQRGFGSIWTHASAMRDPLGWATAPEQGYSAHFQTGLIPNCGPTPVRVIYFSLPDGRVVHYTYDLIRSWVFAK